METKQTTESEAEAPPLKFFFNIAQKLYAILGLLFAITVVYLPLPPVECNQSWLVEHSADDIIILGTKSKIFFVLFFGILSVIKATIASFFYSIQIYSPLNMGNTCVCLFVRCLMFAVCSCK